MNDIVKELGWYGATVDLKDYAHIFKKYTEDDPCVCKYDVLEEEANSTYVDENDVTKFSIICDRCDYLTSDKAIKMLVSAMKEVETELQKDK